MPLQGSSSIVVGTATDPESCGKKWTAQHESIYHDMLSGPNSVSSQELRLDIAARPGFDVNAVSEYGDMRLTHAAARLSVEHLQVLKEFGADFRLLDVRLSSAMHYANSAAIVHWLFDEGVSLDECDSDGCTPLAIVVSDSGSDWEHGLSLETSEAMIELGSDVNARDRLGNTPFSKDLNWCSGPASLRILNIILAAGADLNTRNNLGRTAMHQAALRHSSFALIQLAAHGASLDVQDEDGFCPYEWASQPCAYALNALGVSKEGLPDFCNQYKILREPRIISAVRSECPLLMRAHLSKFPKSADRELAPAKRLIEIHELIEVGAVLNAHLASLAIEETLNMTKPPKISVPITQAPVINLRGLDWTELHDTLCRSLDRNASQAISADQLRDQIEKTPGFNVNALHEGGLRRLMNIAVLQSVEHMQVLKEQGADLKLLDVAGASVMHAPLSPEMVHWLNKEGLSINSKDIAGRTPLHNTIHYTFTSVAEALVALGADVNAKDQFGETPLFAMSGNHFNESMCSFLIGAGAKIDTKSNLGLTALHFAAGNVSENVLMMLIKYGANLEMETSRGLRPVHMAALHHSVACISTLNALGASMRGVTSEKRSTDNLLLDSRLVSASKVSNPMVMRAHLQKYPDTDPEQVAVATKLLKKLRSNEVAAVLQSHLAARAVDEMLAPKVSSIRRKLTP